MSPASGSAFRWTKLGFAGRSLNGEFAVSPSPDRNPRNLQVSQVSMSGLPDGMVESLLGSRSVQSYVDEFASEHGITSFTIENNKVILETTAAAGDHCMISRTKTFS